MAVPPVQYRMWRFHGRFAGFSGGFLYPLSRIEKLTLSDSFGQSIKGLWAFLDFPKGMKLGWYFDIAPPDL